MKELKLGLQMGYWGALPPPDIIGTAQHAEKLGYDSVLTAEAWGNDAFTPLAWIGAHTPRIRLGPSVAPPPARTPPPAALGRRVGLPGGDLVFWTPRPGAGHDLFEFARGGSQHGSSRSLIHPA